LKDYEFSKNNIIVRDLNVILNSKEKRGGNIVKEPFREKIEHLMMVCDLVYIKPAKGKYTWTNRRINSSHNVARLYRFIIQSDLLLSNNIINSRIILSTVSDHKPISLQVLVSLNFGPLPFRFNPLWLYISKILEIILEDLGKWAMGSPTYIWEYKLKVVKLALKEWESFHTSPLKKKNLKSNPNLKPYR
jgi:hypothetical protein